MKLALAIISIVGLAACLFTLLVLTRLEVRRRESTIVTIVFSILIFALSFLFLSNSLEWAWSELLLDPYEDMVALILPLVWGALFFVLAQTHRQRLLERNESRLRALFTHTVDPLLVFDENLVIVEANDQAVHSLGYFYGDLVGMRLDEIEQDWSAEQLLDVLQSMRSNKPLTLSGVHRHRSGSTYPVEVRIQGIELDGMSGYLALARDVSRRLDAQKLAEANAARSQAMSQRLEVLHEVGNILQQAPDFDTLCYWAVELGLQKLEFGRIALKIYDEEHFQARGTFGTDAQGQVVDERDHRLRLISVELRNKMSQRVPGHITEDNVTLFDHNKILKQGQQVLAPLWDGSRITGYLEIDNCLTNKPIPEETKQILALYASTVGHMIGRFDRDEQLRQRERFLRDVFDSFQSGLSVIDRDLNVVRTNRYMREKYNMTEEDGKHKCHAVFRASSEVCESCPTQEVFRTGEPQRTTMRVFDPQLKEERSLDVAAYPMRDSDGQVRWAIEFTNDITEEIRKNEEHRRFEEQMQMTQKLESLGVLAGGVAHDFNNLLMGIQGHADLALCELDANHAVSKHVKGIGDSAAQASELCRQMLAYAGRGNFIVEVMDLGNLLQDMKSLLISSIPKKTAFHIEVAEDLPTIRADQTQIRQILMNLVTNSAEAIGDQAGTVDLKIEAVEVGEEEPTSFYTGKSLAPGSYVEITVSDTGCGMDAETLRKLCDPFFTTKFQGRGLGMAAVLGIVRSYEGDVRVESEPGAGTQVRLRLPACDEEVEEDRVSKYNFDVEESEAAPEGVVLLVDDEMVVREVGQGMLERIGFETITAVDGQDGLDKFRERSDQILFVILDMTMPRMDGEETLRAMRAIRPDVPILISSGYTEQEILGRFEDQHISGFVPKPYSMSNLEKCTQRVLEDIRE